MESPFDPRTTFVFASAILVILYTQYKRKPLSGKKNQQADEDDIADLKAAFEQQYSDQKIPLIWNGKTSEYADQNVNNMWVAWRSGSIRIDSEYKTFVPRLIDQLHFFMMLAVGITMVFLFLNAAGKPTDDYRRTMYNLALSDPSFGLLQTDLASVSTCYDNISIIDSVTHFFEPEWPVEHCYASVEGFTKHPTEFKQFRDAHMIIFKEAGKPIGPPPPK